jgi:hypothetical protein
MLRPVDCAVRVADDLAHWRTRDPWQVMAAADALKWTDAPPGKAGPASQPPQALKSGPK